MCVARGQEDGVATQLENTGFKGNSGAGGRFFKDHAQHFALEGFVGDALLALLLEFNGALNNLVELGWRAVEHGQEVPNVHAVVSVIKSR